MNPKQAKAFKERCDFLQKIIMKLAPLYNSNQCNKKQKALMEITIGATIFYLTSSKDLYTGQISTAALKLVEEGTPPGKLVKEHRFPRKEAGINLLSKHYNQLKAKSTTLYKLATSDYCKYNLVTKEENVLLKKHQKNFRDVQTPYTEAKIVLKDKSYEELTALSKLKKKKG